MTQHNGDEITVYFDGGCPLCRAEISLYKETDGAEVIDFVDITQSHDLGEDLDPEEAAARFHVRKPDGSLVSGAEGFVEVWLRLRGWRWLAAMAQIPGMLWLMEGAYRAFLPVRPYLAKKLGPHLRKRETAQA
ncbi:thiol-disulfide oxidoreductase DCC family protein [Roseovarius aestuariivivens]|uniref:thiol-disulfide oxidoreductase DCC family protein n=1 Tax=Roseovarius aestuariivivens TaxID=1888910 RepID=UPI001AEC3B8B|nr:DUF393 domain-containing protein [Roseovarius aestuariivivens]